MDYDDNDFQSQNRHLGGEGNSKISPVLRPYAIPKFDFDDGLQGHLRFDSLVENEVFLGIPSQEDNQWIEDFSRGSSGIEFSSGAAESCSISRHNNVWSEATSSESVEMLLKSVGQEEMVPGESIIEDLDACGKIGGLTQQMEPHMEQGDKMKDVMNSGSALPSDGIVEHASRLNDVEDTSKTKDSEYSAHGSTQESDPNMSSKGHVEIVTENNPGVVRKSDDANQIEVDASVNESHDSELRKELSGSVNEPRDSEIQHAGCVQVLETQESEGHASDGSFENAKKLSKETCKAGEKHALSKVTETGNQILKRSDETCSYNLGNETSSKVESTEHHGVEAGIGSFEEPSSLPQKGEDNLLIVGGCGENHPSIDPGQPSKCEPMDLSNNGKEMYQQSNGNNHEEHVLEISNTNAGILASSEMKIDLTLHGANSSVEALERKSFQQERDIPLNNEESVSNPETSLMSGVGNKHFDGQTVGSSGNYVGDCSSLTVESSTTEFLVEKQAVENLIGVDDASVAQKEDSNAEGHASSPEVVGSLQANDGNLISNTNDMHNSQDALPNEKENAKVPDDPSNMEHEVVKSLSRDKRVESSLQGVDVKVNDEVIPRSDCVATCGNDPVLDVAVEKADLVHGIAVDQVTGTVDKRKAEDESLTEANLLSSKKTSEGPSELGRPVSGSEKGASHSSSENKVVNQSLVTKENCHSGNGVEQSINLVQETVDHSLPVVETSNKLEDCTMPCDSAIKESGGAQGLVIPGNPEAALEEKLELASSKVEDSIKSGCSTPTITNSTALSQGEKDKKEGVEGSISNIVPSSEVAVQFTAPTVSGDTAAKDEGSASVEVHTSAALSESQASKDVQSTKTTQASKLSMIGEISPSSPSAGLVDPKMVLEPSGGSSQVPDGETARGGSRSTPQRKTKRASGRSSGKLNAKKGNVEKETTPGRQSERGDKSYSASASVAGTSQLVLFEGLKPHGNVEHSGAVLHGVVSVPTSNSADFTTSAPVSVLFQQPFTDLQQVQLRAQIFVYGSLIQGAAPEEACMVSAFGASDGGRSVWEPVWRACVERIQGHKSHPSKSETPVKSRSGGKVPDQSVKQGARQSKVASSPLGQASSKGTPPPVVNSIMPISSPLWNISTPSDGLQSSGMPRGSPLDYHPLHPFQTPASRSFVGHTASWLSQSPFPGGWIPPQTSSVFDAGGRFSLLPPTETVKLTPVKEPSVSASVSSGAKHVSPSTVVHSTGPSFVPGASSLSDMKKSTLLSGQNSTDQKSRKRKKVTVSDDLGQVSLIAQTQLESVPAPVVTTHLSTSVVVSTPACFSSKGIAKNIVTTVSPTSSPGEPKRGEQNAEQAKIPEETSSKVEHAKRQAEDAANLAADAVSHSLSVWSQLDKQKSSLLVPDLEAKLTSAAVAVAAAAAVAKAAAAAAKVASNAALQAKLMAEEALTCSTTINPAESSAASPPNVLNNLGKVTPASILKGDGSNSSSSIIIAAKEAARRRLEAASAASKHAENLDAIVKAAELAAKAVSQVGKIVAVGSPLPLNELLEAGPEGFWRTPQQCTIERSKTGSIEENLSNAGKHFKEGLSAKGAGAKAKATDFGLPPLPREVSRESTEDHMRGVDGISNTFTTSEKDSRGQRSRRASDLAKTIGVIPESEIGLRSASITDQVEYEKGVGTLKENSIKEGSLVEVLKDGDKFKTAWYAANVLSLKDGKAFVSYTELLSDEGSGELKELVALEGEVNSAPKIRIAHPMTAMRFEGTRKRRRAAMGDYSWSIGDRVDVWTQDSWREGVVTDKNQKDETTLIVHFPAEGETSVVKVWHLRPTLIWKDGVWIEWSSSIAKGSSSQGDTPQEKRLKLGTASTEGRGKDKMSKDIELLESGKPDESQSLSLAANEKKFNVGKNTGDENKPNRTMRTGLQKGGSRVIFGVPKPGKKRKFMEVSKHYTAERGSKTNELTESVKFAKHPPPQESGTRGSKSHAKIDSKEGTKSKARVNRSGKPLNVSSRTVLRNNKFLTSELPAQTGSAAVDSLVRDSVSNNEKETARENPMEFGSVSHTEGAAEENGQDAPLKKMAVPNAKSEQANRGKLAPSSGKVAKAEVKEKPSNDDAGKSNLEVVEPRRSNRRIQPTSRLLEGLQSSLIISKIPAVSQSHRSQNRGTFKGNNHG